MDEWLAQGRNWLAGVLVVAALGAGVALAAPLLQRPNAPPVQLVASPVSTPIAAEIQVHVAGAVQQPGLYALAAGSRAGEAITAAMPADDADLNGLNLAARLVDGQRLVVPRLGEAPPAAAAGGARRAEASGSPNGAGKLDLNTATAAQLDALPGIGPVLAGRIVDYRQRNGPFRSVQQLRDARLIPNATYERIRELVAVE